MQCTTEPCAAKPCILRARLLSIPIARLRQTRVVKSGKVSPGRVGLARRAKPPPDTVPNCTHVVRPRLSEASLLDPCRLPQHQLQAASCDRRYTRRLPSHAHLDCATISVPQCAMSTQQQQGRSDEDARADSSQGNSGSVTPTTICKSMAANGNLADVALRRASQGHGRHCAPTTPMREPCPRASPHRTTQPSALHGNHTQLLIMKGPA